MAKIDELRKEIDDIDDKLSALYIKRMQVSKAIGEEKAKTSSPINVSAREKEVLLRVTKNAPEDQKLYLKQLYEDIFIQSKSYQGKFCEVKSKVAEKLRSKLSGGEEKFPVSASVACQGVVGAYGGVAAEKLFALSDVTYFKTFDAVFSAVDKGLCDYGVLPIENSTAGSVAEVYDLMKKHSFYIVKSVRVKISHVLAAKKGAKAENIKTVLSHPQALAQCSRFLESAKVKISEAENTAVAAEKIAKGSDETAAVICSKDCADLYGLSVLNADVMNAKDNYTRFICISKDLKIFGGADKISVMTSLSNKPGSLNKTLSRFASLGLNLTKLESRPIGGYPFEFMFYFDFEGDISSEGVLSLLSEMENASDKFVFLGSYKEVLQ